VSPARRRRSLSIDAVDDLVQAATPPDRDPTLTVMLDAVPEREPGEDELDRVAHRVLRSALEQRHLRQVRQGIGATAGCPPTISNA
jgi:hypothetical protein